MNVQKYLLKPLKIRAFIRIMGVNAFASVLLLQK